MPANQEQSHEMTRAISGAIFASCLCLSVSVFAADWPKWRGPNEDGIAPETGINKEWNARPPEELWRVSLSDGGHGGPSVAEGKVFIIDHEGGEDIVRALDLATGQDLWRFSYPDLTKPDQGFTRTTPVYSEGKLYTVSNLGKVHCLNASRWEQIWSKDMRSDFRGARPNWGYGSSALVDGEKVIVCPGGDETEVVALNKDTGETVWTRGGSDRPGYSTPVKAVIQGQEQYVLLTGKSVIGLSAEKGDLLWRFPWETDGDLNIATPVVIGDSVFVSSDYGHGCALVAVAPDGPTALWENKEVRAHFSSPIFYQDYIFANSNPGHLVCLDPQTGDAMWKREGFEKGGLVMVDGVIIAVDGRGGDVVMVAATPDSYQELGRIRPLGGQSWTAPIVAHGKLIVRNTTAMVCLNLM